MHWSRLPWWPGDDEPPIEGLLRNGSLTQLPRGYPWFQGIEEECVRKINVKLYLMQEMTGDL